MKLTFRLPLEGRQNGCQSRSRVEARGFELRYDEIFRRSIDVDTSSLNGYNAKLYQDEISREHEREETNNLKV